MKRQVCLPQCNFVTSTGMDQAYRSWRLRSRSGFLTDRSCGCRWLSCCLASASNPRDALCDFSQLMRMQAPSTGPCFVAQRTASESSETWRDSPRQERRGSTSHPRSSSQIYPDMSKPHPFATPAGSWQRPAYDQSVQKPCTQTHRPGSRAWSRGTRDRLAPPRRPEMRETVTAISRRS